MSHGNHVPPELAAMMAAGGGQAALPLPLPVQVLLSDDQLIGLMAALLAPVMMESHQERLPDEPNAPGPRFQTVIRLPDPGRAAEMAAELLVYGKVLATSGNIPPIAQRARVRFGLVDPRDHE